MQRDLKIKYLTVIIYCNEYISKMKTVGFD